MINNATFEEIGQTWGSSATAIQFSFRNQANFYSQFLCYQCAFDPVPLPVAPCRFFRVLSLSCPIKFAGDQTKYTVALKISVTVAAFIIFKGLIEFVKRQ